MVSSQWFLAMVGRGNWRGCWDSQFCCCFLDQFYPIALRARRIAMNESTCFLSVSSMSLFWYFDFLLLGSDMVRVLCAHVNHLLITNDVYLKYFVKCERFVFKRSWNVHNVLYKLIRKQLGSHGVNYLSINLQLIFVFGIMFCERFIV